MDRVHVHDDDQNIWNSLMRMIRQEPLEKTLKKKHLPYGVREQYLFWRRLLEDVRLFLEKSGSWKDFINEADVSFDIDPRDNKQQNIEKFLFVLDYEGNNWKHNRYIELKIIGASATGIYFLRSTLSQQLILTIGEYHTTKKNNTQQILQTLAHHYQCPIDVLVEIPYVSYPLKHTGNSLISYFYEDNFCLRRGAVPKQHDLLRQQNKQYFKKCIVPFQGKIKLWATDVRQTSWFRWFMYILYLEEGQSVPKEILLETQQLFLTSFDYDLYHKDPKSYDKVVSRLHKNLLQKIIQTSSSDLHTRITRGRKYTELLQQLQKNKEKDHMRFMESLSYFTPQIARNLCQYIIREYKSPNFSKHVLLSMADVYNYIRMCRLLRENINRVIVMFMGVHHVSRLDRIIQENPSIYYQKDVVKNKVVFPIIRSYGVQKSPINGIAMVLKELPASKKTRMKAYQDRITK